MAERGERVRRGWSRRRLIALAAALLLLLALLVLWSQRTEIATGYVDRTLVGRGVTARYRITRIGLHRERLEDLVIGDPAHPDLTARWVEIEMSYGLRAPRVRGIVARGVRIEGRLVDGKLLLGQVDRLLGPPSGKPFRLPDIDLDVADAGMRLATPAGILGFAAEGKGNAASGFAGRLAVSGRHLAAGGCTIVGARGLLALRTSGRRPNFDGPVRAGSVACGSVRSLAPRLTLAATLAPGLDSWIGRSGLAAASLQSGANRVEGLDGSLTFAGDASRTRGSLDLTAATARLTQASASRLAFAGGYDLAPTRGLFALSGDLKAEAAVAAPGTLRGVARGAGSLAGTPLEPLAAAVARAAAKAGRAFSGGGHIALAAGRGGAVLRATSIALDSASGAHLTLGGGEGLRYDLQSGRLQFASSVSLSGGGFPATEARLARANGGFSGNVRIAPFAAGGARLALSELVLRPVPGGGTSIFGHALIDGPLGTGRVVGLSLPVAARVGPGGLVFGERCLAASFRSLRLSDLSLDSARLPVCPAGAALLWTDSSGHVRGGGVLSGLRLAGRLGSSPIAIAPERLRLTIADSSFAADRLAVRLGSPGRVNRFDIASLTGRFTRGGVAGGFAGTAAQIADVPLLVSGAHGTWSLVGGNVALDGALGLTDAAAPARFNPLASRDFHVAIAHGRIDATGRLHEPATGTAVADVRIEHVLASGAGRALIGVPGIAFGEHFQPEQLTRLTVGVIALVKGTLKGNAEIAWSADGVRSTGTFSTQDMNLAAAFGPVTGLTSTIRFTDLLGLQTAPGKLATVKEIQAGVDVFDGRIRYQLLPDLKVKVESAAWPFAGGQLALDETVLDFSRPSEKHLTFRVAGLDGATFIQEMEFSNIAATGTFDGVVPMIFDQRGGRVVAGHLEARPPGGTLSYVGELTDKQLGTYGKLAFDALKSLRYSSLTVDLNGLLDGEFVAGVKFEGVARNAPAPGGLAGRALHELAKLPFRFNITARGPFRALIGTMRSLKDPTQLIQSALPAELRDKPAVQVPPAPVQPQESEDKR